jgi:hypothetical protein
MLQGQRDLQTLANMLLSELAPLVRAQQGAFYVVEADDRGQRRLRHLAGYADATVAEPSLAHAGVRARA